MYGGKFFGFSVSPRRRQIIRKLVSLEGKLNSVLFDADLNREVRPDKTLLVVPKLYVLSILIFNRLSFE